MTQPKQRIDVFISSTSIDLLEYRAAVTAAILTLGLYPSGMETWATQDESSVDLCRRKVDAAELFVGIYAYRYGWCPPGYDGKSITELEYDWATARGIPRLCFVMSDDHGFPESRKETDAEAQAKLKAFKARVKERTVGFFTTPDDLKARVTASLAELVKLIDAELATPRCNFVPKPEHFVGRVDEIKHLRESLQTGGAITAITALKGIGGIGKTTLAQAYAHQDERFSLKLYASLGQHYRENMEPLVMEGWIGGNFPPGTPLETMIAYTRQQLSASDCGSPCLLVIDDVWAETVEAARRLRQAAPPDTYVLITTRSEDVAAALDAATTPLDALTPDEGADLLLDLIRDARAVACRDDFKAISRLLGGHSLALSLAARQLRRNFQARRVTELRDTLDKGVRAGDPFPDLKLERADAASKLDSVSLTLKLTLDTLQADDPDLHEKRLKQFRALGALPPDIAFRARHAYAIWQEDDADALDDFAAEGLITPDETRDDWYTQHRLLRAYARALLVEQDELSLFEDQNRSYVQNLVKEIFTTNSNWLMSLEDMQQIQFFESELVSWITQTDDPVEQTQYFRAIVNTMESASTISPADKLLLQTIDLSSHPSRIALIFAFMSIGISVKSFGVERLKVQSSDFKLEFLQDVIKDASKALLSSENSSFPQMSTILEKFHHWQMGKINTENLISDLKAIIPSVSAERAVTELEHLLASIGLPRIMMLWLSQQKTAAVAELRSLISLKNTLAQSTEIEEAYLQIWLSELGD